MNYFTNDELKCKCCGINKFNSETLQKLNKIRNIAGFPFIITSGYRCKAYNFEKGYTQTHATGQAADISCNRESAVTIVGLALAGGFTGIGVKQKGSNRFIHLDDLHQTDKRIRPTIWSY